MNTLLNISGTVNFRAPTQGLQRISDAKFRSVMIETDNIFICEHKTPQAYYEALCKDDILDKAAHNLFDRFVANKIDIGIIRVSSIINAPLIINASELSKKLALKTIKFCGEYGCRYAIIPCPDEKARTDYYLSLAGSAKENNVILLLENECNDLDGHFVRSPFSDAYKLSAFTDELNREIGSDVFGICLNTKYCNLCGIDMNEFCVTAGERIKAVILCENDGMGSASLLPFTSVKYGPRTDWLGLIRGLRKIDFSGDLALDISGTASGFSQLLIPELLLLSKSVADFFAWQINIEKALRKYNKRVLFGAGNMCKNYMRCYGDQYPPLFTCDNDQSKWGSTYCGLEVRPPYELKNLPDDCAVFICNTFYGEIEKQLKDMHINSPIEYFNDEYLPSLPYEWPEV